MSSLHIQKLGLELKCPLCLSFLNKPTLLPCDHIFCNDCVPKSAQSRSPCPSCNHDFADEELRPAPYIENMVIIYRSFEATFRDTIFQPLSTEIDMNHLSPATSNSFNVINESVEKCKNPDSKRQKKMSYNMPETYAQQESCTGNETISMKSLCAFCHSSKLSDGSGPMLYYANGKEVVGDISKISNVIPVHQKCIEWTPQVYFEGEKIKNLESELGRASKLKCSRCGIKGAGLGCFAQSCRNTYHVPCAYDILDCRWDCQDFLMLCPKHNNLKFPKENSKRVNLPKVKKSKVGKCTPSTSSEKLGMLNQISSSKSNFWEASPSGPKEWVFCGSALSSEDKYSLLKFASMCGATVTKNWKSNVTHVIAATDANGACSRTLKVLMSILHGKWILTMDWVKACMEANYPMYEESYEVELDNHGYHDGPKTGRLRVLNNEPKLFDGLRFYFSGDFVEAYKADLLDLVETGGGIIIESKEKLVATSCSCIIVYNSDPPQGCPFGEEGNIVMQRLEEAQDLAKEVTSSKVVRHTWVLESIAASKLRPFGSCS